MNRNKRRGDNMAYKTFAAIDVGSYELAMKVFEISSKNGIREIDYVRHRIELGTDSYLKGKLTNERMDELCRILREYTEIMKSKTVVRGSPLSSFRASSLEVFQ